jgi:hypothetical protein
MVKQLLLLLSLKYVPVLQQVLVTIEYNKMYLITQLLVFHSKT